MQPSPGPGTTSNINDAGKDRASASFLSYVRGGDIDALEAALLQCTPAVRRFAKRLGARSEVDDLVHDCFVVAIRRARRFDGRGPLLPWLLGILQNLARSRHRARWARLRSVDGDGNGDDAKIAEPAIEAPPIVDRADWLSAVDAELANLAEPYRSVVRAHLVAGEPLAAIAARLGRPSPTVRSQFARGLSDLRRRLPAPILAGLASFLAVRSAHAEGGGWWTTRRSTLPIAAALLVAAVWLGFSAEAAAGSPVAVTGVAAASAPSTAAPDAALDPTAAPVVSTREEAPAIHVRLTQRDGSPVVGLPVILDPDFVLGQTAARSCALWRVASTDETGVAHFAITGPGRAALRLHDIEVLHVFDVGERSIHLAFPVDAPPPFRIRLVDEAEKPIAGGRCFVSGARGATAPGYPVGTTAADGYVTVRCPLPRYYWWAIAEDQLSTPAFQLDAAGMLPGCAYSLRLARWTRRHGGMVHAGDGQPLGGAWVAIWSEANDVTRPQFVRADRNGYFSVSGFAAGDWAAAAFVPGFAIAQSPQLADGDEADLRLTRGGTLSGRVDMAIGTDTSRLRVIAQADGTLRNPLGGNASLVGNDGAFRIEHVAPGPYAVGLMRQGSRPLANRKVNAVEDTVVHVDFTIDTTPQWDVRVEDERHRPLVDHLVRVTNTADADAEYSDVARTDDRGVARLRAPGAGPTRVAVHLPSRAGHDELPCWEIQPVLASELSCVTVPDDARRTCHLRGVLPTDFLAADPQCQVRIARSGCSRALQTGATGAFVGDAMPPGDYTLELSLAQDGAHWIVPFADVTLREGDNEWAGALPPLVDFELAWPPGGARVNTTVFVRDAAEHLVENMLLPPDRPARRRLLPGEYVARYVNAAGEPIEHRFAVDAAHRDARIELPRTAGQPCRIEVHTACDLPFAGVLGSLRRVGSAAAGRLLLRAVPGRSTWRVDLDLEPGVYELSVRAGWPPETRGMLTVVASDQIAVHPFELK